MDREKLKKIDKQIQIPLMVLTTSAYVILLMGFWQGAYITIIAQPLWFFTSWVNRQIGIIVTTIIIFLGSIFCVLRGLGMIKWY